MGQKVSFYIAPHPDDWLLFCGAQAYSDLLGEDIRPVFIYITAGDAGRSDGWWEAREQAALAAVSNKASNPPFQESCLIHGHYITKYVQKTSISYCFRLPDGLPDGNGSFLYRYESLTNLQKRSLPISAVDGSTTYASWEDFQATLSALLERETREASRDEIWIHALEYASLLNPNDHADHKATGDAIREIAQGNYNRCWWLSYCIYYCEPNLSAQEIERKQHLFLTYSHEMKERMNVAHNEVEWICWGSKAYCRQVVWNERDLDAPPLYPGCLALQQFEPEGLFDETIHYLRCGTADEQMEEDGLCLINQLTQKKVALNSAAVVFWDLLKEPCTIGTFTSLLAEMDENIFPEKHLETVRSLLETLLRAKLIKQVD